VHFIKRDTKEMFFDILLWQSRTRILLPEYITHNEEVAIITIST